MPDENPLTPAEREEIEARAEKATKGPCVIRRVTYLLDDRDDPTYEISNSGDQHWIAHTLTEDNAQFYAHARTDVPRLLAEVKRQAEEIASLKQVPDNEAWKSMLAVAYQMGGDCARNIQAITSYYLSMRNERDALQAKVECERDCYAPGERRKLRFQLRAVLRAIAEYRNWFDTCTKTLAPDWEGRAADASEELDGAINEAKKLVAGTPEEVKRG